VKEEDSYQMIEGDVARLRPGSTWKQYASKNVSETTLQGLAQLRLKHIYPKEWMYNDEDELLELCLAKCPGVPLPPYQSKLSLTSAMDETALDTAPPGSALYLALEAACLLDNERDERLTEDEEKGSGILRPSLTGEKQMARRRTRKVGLVFGNGVGPGGLDTAVCRADALSVARHLGDLEVKVTVLLDATLDQMLDAIKAFAHDLVESDLVIFYFSGHARSAQGINYLVPSGGPTDNLDTANKFATRAVRLREDVIQPLQCVIGTLTFIIIDGFRASQSIPSPAGCGLWRQGKGDWHRRIPACFLPHIRPPGLASSNLEYPSRSCEGMGQETSIDSLDDSFDSTHLESAAGIVDSVAAVMEGTLMGVPKNTWSVLAGDCMIEETNLEEELATEASMCVIFSNQPGGDVFANEAMLKSPFTDQFTTHLYNPGGGAHHAGGNYPMMLADIKSSVMKMTNGRQMPWTSIVPRDADKVFCFVPPPIPPGKTRASAD